MKDAQAAARYAKAAIESAADDAEVARIGEELAVLATAFTAEPTLKKILMHPGIEAGAKLKVLAEIGNEVGVSPKTGKTLEAAFENGRIGLLPEISDSYQELADTRLNRVRVHVRSAHPIDDADEKELSAKFKDMTGKDPHMEIEIDKSLIGGLVARVGSKVYDGSLSNQLRLMKVKLEQEA